MATYKQGVNRSKSAMCATNSMRGILLNGKAMSAIQNREMSLQIVVCHAMATLKHL
jgi:hypothetical protein